MSQQRPIPSYGVILFTRFNGIPYYLIAQRRDTIEYVECLNHKCDALKFPKLCSLMTVEERQRILSHINDFDSLWHDYTLCPHYKGTRLYLQAKKHFEETKYILLYAIYNTRPTKISPPWGFPKGRKHYKEDVKTCAMREFEEETKISKKKIKEYSTEMITETFVGSNGNLYSTAYMVCEISSMHPIVYMSSNSPIIGRDRIICKEMQNLKWVDIQQAMMYLDERRYKLLLKAHKIVKF